MIPLALSARPHPNRNLLARLRHALDLHRARRALLVMDDHLLHDVGLTRAQALAEAAKPLWDAPPSWRL